MFACGFNGFGQIQSNCDADTISIPSLLACQAQGILVESVACALWSNILFMRENGEIFIRGFTDDKNNQEEDVNLSPLKGCGEVIKICMDNENFFYLDEKGSAWMKSPGVSKNEITNRVSDFKFKDLRYCDISQELLLLEENGKLFSWKMNGGMTAIPMKLPEPHVVKKISCGINHTLALVDNGTVLSWGIGSRGQLGHGNMDDVHDPRVIDSLVGVEITAVSAGGWHSAALASTGDAYMWGWNQMGQLGFMANSSFHSVSSKKNPSNSDQHNSAGGNMSSPGDFVALINTPTLLELEDYLKSDKFITLSSISCGTKHTAASTTCGKAITWGWSKYGQLAQDCCHSGKNDGAKMKRRKLSSVKCADEPHLPKLVNFFQNSDLFVLSVECYHWNTFFKTVRQK